jgi:hypothetical protein
MRRIMLSLAALCPVLRCFNLLAETRDCACCHCHAGQHVCFCSRHARESAAAAR